MRIENDETEHQKVMLFPFDDVALPFQKGLRLQLVGYQSPVGGTRIVVPLGSPDSPDGKMVTYYGTVISVDGELRMWYLGQGDEENWHQRVCFARSADGFVWEKPNLGLVEYRGSSRNNLVDLEQGCKHVTACVVFHDPDDPDPKGRFKIAYEAAEHEQKLAVAFSGDGLCWTPHPENPRGGMFEMAGGTKLNGCYYLTGQGDWSSHSGTKRELLTMASYDFEHWTEATCLGFRRGNLLPRAEPHRGNDGEQTHLGAALWNRGNVVVGFYGMWHGHPTDDRRLVSMDLGLVVTNDALHYREPVPDFPIVACAEDDFPSPPTELTQTSPALIQGQGFENVGDQTLFWYAPWPEHRSNGIRVATWTRDRLGYLAPMHSGRPHCISAVIRPRGRPLDVFMNVDGLSEHNSVTVEILDEQFRPLPGYESHASVGVQESGLRHPVVWSDKDAVEAQVGGIRLRIDFGGVRPEDVRLYAVYVEEADG